jgi:hypothetical protein
LIASAQVPDGQNAKVGVPTIIYSLRMLRKLMHGMRKRKMLTDVPSMPFEKEATLRNELTEEEQAAYLSAFDNEAGFHSYLKTTVFWGARLSLRVTRAIAGSEDR